MLKWIETTGRSEEDAIAAALFQLGLDRDDVSVEVIERAKSGFLGFGSNPAKSGPLLSRRRPSFLPRKRRRRRPPPPLGRRRLSWPPSRAWSPRKRASPGRSGAPGPGGGSRCRAVTRCSLEAPPRPRSLSLWSL